MRFIQMRPVVEWHTNKVFQGDGDTVEDLPCTVIDKPDLDFYGHHSVWFCRSLIARFMFLIFGKISFVAMGTKHPPIIIGVGNYCEVEKDGSI